jgi:hypothetical protein
MQIMLSPTVAQASDSRISPESTATSDAFFGNVLDLWMSNNGGSCVLALI